MEFVAVEGVVEEEKKREEVVVEEQQQEQEQQQQQQQQQQESSKKQQKKRDKKKKKRAAERDAVEKEERDLREFEELLNKFLREFLTTYPEYCRVVISWWGSLASSNRSLEVIRPVLAHCVRVFPEHFFNILYCNADIFARESVENTEFLPGIVFKHLWYADGVLDETRNVLWQYLQLILCMVVKHVEDKDAFGDASSLFEAISEEELRARLEQVFRSFPGAEAGAETKEGETGEAETKEGGGGGGGEEETIGVHLQSLLQGKIGRLAAEMTEELVKELGMTEEDLQDRHRLWNVVLKQPGKLMNVFKKIVEKLREKVQTGEVKESELVMEGKEFLNRVQTCPKLMKEMQEMMKGIPGMGQANFKKHQGAMDAHLSQKLRQAKIRERMKARHAARMQEYQAKAEAEAQQEAETIPRG